MNYFLKEFGVKLKEIRLNLFLTQKDVESLIGVNVDTLRRLENGLSLAKIDTLDKLSIIYKVDLYVLFNSYRNTIDNYISNRMKVINKRFHNYSYDLIRHEAELLKSNFETSSLQNDELITKKLRQFTEYLISLQNVYNSASDISRFDLSNIFNALGYSLSDFYNPDINFVFDKLEIRILILASIIYRTKGEFKNSFRLIDEAQIQLKRNYFNDSEFTYLYITITYNKMMYYHRIDSHDDIAALHAETLHLFDSEIGIQNIASYFIRVGVNMHFQRNSYADIYVNTGISLLHDCDYPDKADRFKRTLKSKYPSMNIL